MAEEKKDYSIAAVLKAIEVEDFLKQGDILEWRTVREVSEATGLSQNEVFRNLWTLEKKNRVERSDKGWRISPEVIRAAANAQEALAAHAARLGLRRLY